MVFNSAVVGMVATVSADLCQYIACNPQRLSSDQVFDLLCCLPLHHLRRLFSFFCFPVNLGGPHRRFSQNHSSPSSSSSSSSSSDPYYDYDSHSN